MCSNMCACMLSCAQSTLVPEKHCSQLACTTFARCTPCNLCFAHFTCCTHIAHCFCTLHCWCMERTRNSKKLHRANCMIFAQSTPGNLCFAHLGCCTDIAHRFKLLVQKGNKAVVPCAYDGACAFTLRSYELLCCAGPLLPSLVNAGKCW
jgi:hypothetical protein